MFKKTCVIVLAFIFCLALAISSVAAEPNAIVPKDLQISKLFKVLPESYVSTPDGMAINPATGDLIVAAPNFGDQSQPGCILRITKEGKVSKWFEVPVDKESGVARPMGIDFDEEGNLYVIDNQGWTGNAESVNKGRILKILMDEKGKPSKYQIIATGMEHPNGIKIRDGYAYVTQSSLQNVEDESGLLVSCVYRFPTDAKKTIQVNNNLDDENILTTFITLNEKVQYGADGLIFDKEGNLIVGNFGDGALHKISFNEDGSVKSNEVWAKDEKNMATTDGMCIDDEGNIYVADFSRNAIAKVTPDGTVTRIAQSPDSDGAKGQLDQPGEPCIWDGKLIVTCFDMVTDDGKINSTHDAPTTIVYIDFEDIK